MCDRRVLLPSIVFLLLSVLARAEVDLAEFFAKASPSVVTLTTYTARGDKTGQGSGFIIDPSGVIVTCNHVVDGAAIVEVQLADQSTQTATAVIRTEKEWDVALLKVSPVKQDALKLAPPEAVRIGAAVVAIGSPLGYGNTLSQGIISGLRPHNGQSDLIQLTAPISPGSSGGPILSATTGEILGMASGSQSNGQNINFAIPSRVIAEQLKTLDQPPERPLKEFTPEIKKTIAEARSVRENLENECSEGDATTLNRSLQDAIASGVGIYNNGDHLGCYRVYEGAAYKVLYKLAGRSPTAVKVLKGALKKAEDTRDSTASAWIMRNAFDSIIDIHGKKSTAK